jgi:hypothetical protein
MGMSEDAGNKDVTFFTKKWHLSGFDLCRGKRSAEFSLVIMSSDCHFVSTRLYVNPGLFFFIEKDAFYLWDYTNGAQFELEERYVGRIAQIAANPDVAPDAELDAELKANNIIAEKPFPRPEWGFGKPAEIFHFATRHPHFFSV